MATRRVVKDLNERSREIFRNIVDAFVETGEPMDASPWETVDFYRLAIITHRKMLQEYDLEDTEIDRALWATLDNRWDFDKVTL